ncbi:MAG: TonB-dependent receptor, partial [Marinicaulis sp.]|nr:TonB-dependent receptor [Marinicaulis sp.]
MAFTISALVQTSAIIALISASAPSFAQEEANDGASNNSSSRDTIVVTAQRRQESIQDVPIALTALGADDLTKRTVVDLEDLRGAVPGLSISGFTGANASNVISIRGITGQVLAIGSGQAVAVYLDGVYLPRPDSGFFGFDDLERIEVLRGPQGTLYGRNATAGAINIITRDPGSELAAGAEVSYGNFNTVRFQGSLSGPIGGGFSAGISGSYNHHDGYIRNTETGNELNDRETRTVRGKLRYQSPDDRFSAILAGDYTQDDARPVFKNGVLLPSGVFAGIGDPEEFSSDPASEALTMRDTTQWGVGLTLNYEISDSLDLVSITSLREIEIDTFYDADGSQLPVVAVGIDNSSKSFNQEVRGVFTGESLRATVGANYFSEVADFGIGVFPPTVTPFFDNPFDDSDLSAWALFTQLEYDLTNRLTIVGGLRYNNESRDFSIDYTNFAGPLFTGNVKDDAIIPSAGLNFKANSDVLLYAKASQGYQAPGFNFLPGAAATAADTFTAEKLWAYEIGAKTQFWDGR